MIKMSTFLAPGFEEIEATIPIDICTRAGMELSIIAVGGLLTVQSSGGLGIVCDELLEDYEGTSDIVFLPGGMPGSTNLAKSARLLALVAEQLNSNRTLAAICAAPAVVLGANGLLANREFTCYPGMEDLALSGKHSKNKLVIDNKLITAQGVGSAFDLAWAILGGYLSEQEILDIQKKTLWN